MKSARESSRHDHCHYRIEVSPPLLRREFAGHLPGLGGQPAALVLVRVIDLLALASRLFHNGRKLSDPHR